jgi:S1-C subfamily serine protease
MLAALELHKGYPANKDKLAGKQPRPMQFATPEEFPALAGKYKPTLDYAGKVAQSCMHCHQVRDAERIFYRSQSNNIPAEVLFPYPMPDTIGLVLDPTEMARVSKVVPGTPAARAGFKSGDHIEMLASQPLISIADVQWVLQHTPNTAAIDATIRRGSKRLPLQIALQHGWRDKTDISWRTSTWDLRRMALGGMVLREPTAQQRSSSGLSADSPGLHVEYVGMYGDHAAAMRAGFKTNDILRRVGAISAPLSEANLIQQILQNYKPGERVPTTVQRGNQTVELQLPVQ